MRTPSARCRLRVACLALLVPVLGLLAPEPARAAPEEAAPAGRFRNEALGVSAKVPEGWKLSAEAGTPTVWKRLATFWDPVTGSEAVLSARSRSAASVEDLEGAVRRDWAQNPRLQVTAMRRVPSAPPARPVPLVIVDATFTVKSEPKEGDPAPRIPPPPVTYRVNATYFLGPGYEYMLYATAQSTHWSRITARIDALRESFAFEGAEAQASGPVGEGAYRNNEVLFSCRYPSNYGVIVPARSSHVVQFEGIGADDPDLGVYHLAFEGDAADDAARLVDHYQAGGGEARISTIEVFGKQARLVTAQAAVGGKDQTILIAIVKRGSGELFRLRAAMPKGSDAKGRRVFEAFVASFQMGVPAPR